MSGQRAISPSRRRRLEERFAQALQFQRAGNLAEAQRGFRQVVEADPTHVPALHSLALLLHRRGEAAEALSLMRRAAASAAADASVFNNLGNMLVEAGRPDDAVAAYRQAVTLEPAHAAARFSLGVLLLDAGDAGAARGELEMLWASGLREPQLAEALVRSCILGGDPASALSYCEAAVENAQDAPAAGARLASVLLDDRCPREAAQLAGGILAGAPGHLPSLRVLAAARLMLDDFALAAEAYRTLLAAAPGDADGYLGLIRCLVHLGRYDEAVGLCREQIQRSPERADGYGNLGIALRYTGRYEEAVAAFRDAVTREPGFSAAWNNLGMTWLDLGDMEAAAEAFQHALESDPGQPEALFNIIRTRRNDASHGAEIRQLERGLVTPGLDVPGRIFSHFALGKAYDDLGDHDRSFEHYVQGNALKRGSVRFEPRGFQVWAREIADTFDARYFASHEGIGSSSERPVFIVGLPRSGTSLVEQILASHRRVHGAGEMLWVGDLALSLPQRLGVSTPYPRAARELDREHAGPMADEYLRLTAAGDDEVSRVTDKMPENFLHLGLIAVLFPDAHIIHCTRDAMDVCFSNFIQLFDEGHDYAYDLDDIAAFYNGYAGLMAHWASELPMAIHEVRYESLLEDPEKVTRAMVAHVGLDWDDACLDFHRTRRVVRTASHWQVRQPIYRGASGRWRRFSGHLQGLARAIGYRDAAPALAEGAQPRSARGD